jgi:hypothetical protein
MKQVFFSSVLIISILGFASCDGPDCNNTNPIFEINIPESKVYKDELIKQLESIDQSKLSYRLQKYDEKDGKESLYFHIQGDGLCAILELTMTHWEKLESVREKKGVSYRGAEFTNLKFEIKEDSLSTEFIYKTFDRIID